MQNRRCECYRLLIAAMVLTIIAMPATAPAADNKVSNDKVAVVNGTVIPKQDLTRETARVTQQFAVSGKPLEKTQLREIQKEILETLISKELLFQESQKHGINIEDDAVNAQMNTLKARFPGEAEYNKALEQMALSETGLKQEITKGLAIQKLIDREIVQKINISEEDIKAFYDGNPESFKKPEQVKASHILIKVKPEADDATKAAARKKLEDVQGKIKKGGDFESLAKEYSEGPSGPSGGDLGYFGRGQMVKPFEDSAFAMKPGEVSDIVMTQFGYHLIKVVDKQPETVIGYDETKDKIKQYLVQQKARKQLDLYIEALRGKAEVERFLPESAG